MADENSDVLDPKSWKQYPTPVFERNDANGVFGPGHNGFFQSPDGTEDWIVYHAKTSSDFTNKGRSTRAQKFTWNADGTPNFGTPLPLDTILDEPSGEPVTSEEIPFSVIPANSTAKPNAAERLKELKDLYDQGLIIGRFITRKRRKYWTRYETLLPSIDSAAGASRKWFVMVGNGDECACIRQPYRDAEARSRSEWLAWPVLWIVGLY